MGEQDSYCFFFMYSPYRAVILLDDDVPDWWSQQREHTLASHQKTVSLATAERPLTLTADLASYCSLCVVQSIFTEVVFFFLLFFICSALQYIAGFAKATSIKQQ